MAPADRPPADRPLDLGSDEVYARARDVLGSAGFDDGGILAFLGQGELGDAKEGDVELLLAKTAGGSPLETLIRLFLVGADVAAGEAERAVAPMKLEAWLSAGLLESVDGDRIRGAVRLLPFRGLWLAFDRPERGRQVRAEDYVMGVGSSTLTLADLTVRRPARAALDLGTGCGLLAFLAARHSERVVATDRNPRAVGIAAFNARLNGLDAVSCREGDLFEPVGSERFDLVVTNPPFVISPASTFIYRDSGFEGDGITREIVRRVPQHLEVGGYCHVLCNWAHLRGEDWRDRLAAWAEGSGCDVWALCAETRDAATYASTWLRHTEGGEPGRVREQFADWMAFYERLGVEAVSAGSIHLRRRADGASRFRAGPQPSLRGAAGEAVAAGFEAWAFLDALGDGEAGRRGLLQSRLRAADALRLEQQLGLGEAGWTPERTLLRLTEGFGHEGAVDPLMADLVGRCRGREPLGRVLRELAVRAGVSERELEDAALPMVRALVEQGFLRPPPAETPDPARDSA